MLRPIALTTFAILLGIFGAWLWVASAPAPGDPLDAAQVALGRGLYKQHCASCHGANLEGQPNWQTRMANGKLPAPPHDASGHTWHHPDKQLFDITKIGIRPPLVDPGYQSDMPGFGETLSDRDIWAVLAYIKSTWPAAIMRRHAEINARAR